jgi:hypothetical protein
MSPHSSSNSSPSKVSNSVYREKIESEGSIENLEINFIKEDNNSMYLYVLSPFFRIRGRFEISEVVKNNNF